MAGFGPLTPASRSKMRRLADFFKHRNHTHPTDPDAGCERSDAGVEHGGKSSTTARAETIPAITVPDQATTRSTHGNDTVISHRSIDARAGAACERSGPLIEPDFSSAESTTLSTLDNDHTGGLEIEVICEGADLILIPGESPTKQYLMSSKILGDASPVFKAMFSTKWREGRGLSSGAPRIIRLREVDPRSLEILLRYIVHGELAVNGCAMAAAEGPAFADLVDYYDCLAKLASTITHWIEAVDKVTLGFNDICHLCAVAYKLKLANWFERLTCRLITSKTEPFICFTGNGSCSLPPDVLARLDSERRTLQEALRADVETLVRDKDVELPCCCGHFWRASLEVLRLYREIDHQPLVESVAQLTKSIDNFHIASLAHCRFHIYPIARLLEDIKRRARARNQNIADRMRGLSLEP